MKIVFILLITIVYISCKPENSQTFALYSISFQRLKGMEFSANTSYDNSVIFKDTIVLSTMKYPDYLNKTNFNDLWSCAIIDSLQGSIFTSAELQYFEFMMNKIIKEINNSPTIYDIETIYRKTFYNSISNLDSEWNAEIDSFYNYLNSEDKYDVCEKIMYNSIKASLKIRPENGIYFTKKYSKELVSKQFVYIGLENNKVKLIEICPNLRNYNFE